MYLFIDAQHLTFLSSSATDSDEEDGDSEEESYSHYRSPWAQKRSKILGKQHILIFSFALTMKCKLRLSNVVLAIFEGPLDPAEAWKAEDALSLEERRAR